MNSSHLLTNNSAKNKATIGGHKFKIYSHYGGDCGRHTKKRKI